MVCPWHVMVCPRHNVIVCPWHDVIVCTNTFAYLSLNSAHQISFILWNLQAVIRKFSDSCSFNLRQWVNTNFPTPLRWIVL